LGGGGNDTYFVDDPVDVVVENMGGGNDTIHTTVNYTIPDNIQTLPGLRRDQRHR
jgi:hypothetical protein